MADADETVGGEPSRLDPHPLAHPAQQVRGAAHAVGDVVGEQHAVDAGGRERQEVVELGDAAHLRQRQAEPLRDEFERRRRQVVAALLDLAQHLHQSRRLRAPGRDRGVDEGDGVERVDLVDGGVGFRRRMVHGVRALLAAEDVARVPVGDTRNNRGKPDSFRRGV